MSSTTESRTLAIQAAYERLEKAITTTGLSDDSPIRRIALQTLADLRQQIQHDPQWIEHLIENVTRTPGPAVIQKD